MNIKRLEITREKYLQYIWNKTYFPNLKWAHIGQYDKHKNPTQKKRKRKKRGESWRKKYKAEHTAGNVQKEIQMAKELKES